MTKKVSSRTFLTHRTATPETEFFFSPASDTGGCRDCTGKTGKMAKEIPCQGKHREFGNFVKTQRIWFTQIVNSLILKVKDILNFAAKISKKKKLILVDRSLFRNRRQRRKTTENAYLLFLYFEIKSLQRLFNSCKVSFLLTRHFYFKTEYSKIQICP